MIPLTRQASSLTDVRSSDPQRQPQQQNSCISTRNHKRAPKRPAKWLNPKKADRSLFAKPNSRALALLHTWKNSMRLLKNSRKLSA